MLAYTGGPFRLGVEYFSTKNWTAVTTVARDESEGYSLFGSYQFDPQWSVFGRYDHTKPNQDTVAQRKSDYFNLGIDYRPVAIVDLALVYKHEKVGDGTFTTSDGVIGGSRDGTYDEFGLWGQFRW